MSESVMSEPAIVARGLVQRFGSQLVLDGIDLDVAAGEFVAVVGRSRPASRCSSVDFPAPDRPTTATNSPAATSRSMPRRAWMSPKLRRSPRIETAGSAFGASSSVSP